MRLPDDIRSQFLALVRLGIGHSVPDIPESIDWPCIQALAKEHGLTAIVMDGVDAVNALQPPIDIKYQLIGSVVQGFECRYDTYRSAIAEMAAFYRKHGLKMMLLKGMACSMTWPIPQHRPIGDIDIWQFGESGKADDLISSELGINVDSSHHHHTVFHWRGFMVENHFDFINIYHHKSNMELEKIFKELAKDDSHYVDILGEKVYLPSPNLHALFLLKHSMIHFSAGELNLRQLLDWALYVKEYHSEIDWDWLSAVVDRYGMRPAYSIFNAICVEDLGFDPVLFRETACSPEMKERVLSEIISPEFQGEMPDSRLRRIVFKLRRWSANSWKHGLCYSDSMWSAFWSGVKNHLLKPSSI